MNVPKHSPPTVGSMRVAIERAKHDIIANANRQSTREHIRVALLLAENGPYTVETLTAALTDIMGAS